MFTVSLYDSFEPVVVIHHQVEVDSDLLDEPAIITVIETQRDYMHSDYEVEDVFEVEDITIALNITYDEFMNECIKVITH